MIDVFTGHYDLFVVIALATFAVVLGGVSIDDALRAKRP